MAVCLLLVPASAIAGCIAEPSQQFQLRPGDLATVHLVAWNDSDIVIPSQATADGFEALCGGLPGDLSTCPDAAHDYVLAQDVPNQLPDGYEQALRLPTGIQEALTGVTRGETIHVDDVQPWGPHKEELVEHHPLEEELPRQVEDPTAYGRSWETTRFGDGYRIMPTEEDIGETLKIDRWCNDRFCLFESTLEGYNQTHLTVKHHPEAGDRVHVDALDTTLTVTHRAETTFTVDGNHRYAGEPFQVFAHVEHARAPPTSQERATLFEATTLDGEEISLEDRLGSPTILEFFATWCPSCEANAKHLDRIEDRFGDEIDIVSIGVDPWEEAASFDRFIRSNNVTWPVIVDEDGSLSSAYGVGTLSTSIVVSPDGYIAHVETGVADHDRMVHVLETLLEDEAPTEAGTAS